MSTNNIALISTDSKYYSMDASLHWVTLHVYCQRNIEFIAEKFLSLKMIFKI